MEKTICVYCASSQRCDAAYHAAARRVGEVLVEQATASSTAAAQKARWAPSRTARSRAAVRYVGILPRFMKDLEWGHPRLTELHIVEDLRARKHLMFSESHGVVALPGGCGTLEELFEALTLKRLGLYVHPIVLLNTRDYFAPLIELLNHAVEGALHGRAAPRDVAGRRRARRDPARARERAAVVGRRPRVRRHPLEPPEKGTDLFSEEK